MSGGEIEQGSASSDDLRRFVVPAERGPPVPGHPAARLWGYGGYVGPAGGRIGKGPHRHRA